jgi:hypothetical protein
MTPRRPSVKPLIFLVSLGFGVLCFATVSRYGPEANWAREWLAIVPLQLLALGYVGYRYWGKRQGIKSHHDTSRTPIPPKSE